MKPELLQLLISTKQFPHGKSNQVELIETHISQVLLTPKYVYKIKKNIRLNFLNFERLSDRKKYCDAEVRLNRRFSPQMYLNVFPIYTSQHQISFQPIGKIIDYAVQMKRMDQRKEMLTMMNNGNVRDNHIKALAKTIATFHKNEKALQLKYRPTFIAEEYADIESILPTIRKYLSKDIEKEIRDSIKKSFGFVSRNSDFILQRVKEGYFKDCHGDLHMRNIFLYPSPVLFDCIEFKKEFRQIDVLNDLAFLVMDLEASGKKKWARMLIEEYQKHTHEIWSKNTVVLFTYFKSFRACVRAKVAALSLKEHPENLSIKKEVIKYTDLMTSYMKLIR